MRMPLLVMDEALLLVDTYFKTKEIDNPELKRIYIEELSVNIKKLPFFPEMLEYPSFRNIAGMELLLRSLDQLSNDSNISKLPQPSKLQTRIYQYYLGKQALLRDVAEAIVSLTTAGLPIAFLPKNDFIGGNLLMGAHVHLEASDKILSKIKTALVDRGNTVCKICGLDLEKNYGVHATDLMEVHYALPLGKYRANMKVMSSYVIPLCPACHKLAHSDLMLIEEEILRAEITR